MSPQTPDALREQAERLLNERAEAPRPPAVQDREQLIRDLMRQQQELQVHQVELQLQNQQLLQANAELEEARREYQELFDGAPVGYLTLTNSGMIVRSNLTAATQLHVERLRLTGRRFSAYVAPEGASTFALTLRRVFEGPVKRTVELPMVATDGSTFTALLDIVAVPSEGGLLRHCHVTMTDITAQRRAQDEVLRLNATLEERVERRTRQIRELDEELETFVYAVTHDLMTPLRHIRSFTQLLSEATPTQTDQQARHLQHVDQSVERMELLLRALLDFFRTGQQRIRFQDVDLGRLVREVRKDLAPELAGREVQLSTDALPVVYGDRMTLQLALTNLLHNAVKFTRGRPNARIRVFARSTDREHVIAVEDNGVGFNMRQKDRLFGVFQRLHSDREFEGTGIGLALVRRIVHRHGGRVWAEGFPDRGATFFFSLPKDRETRD